MGCGQFSSFSWAPTTSVRLSTGPDVVVAVKLAIVVPLRTRTASIVDFLPSLSCSAVRRHAFVATRGRARHDLGDLQCLGAVDGAETAAAGLPLRSDVGDVVLALVPYQECRDTLVTVPSFGARVCAWPPVPVTIPPRIAVTRSRHSGLPAEKISTWSFRDLPGSRAGRRA